MTAAELIAAIEQRTRRQGKRQGRNTRLLCPVHDDHEPSLDVAEGADGKPLVQCRSRGCSFEQVLAALGAVSRNADIVATYEYVDERGVLLYQVLRKVGKKFSQRRPDLVGGWIYNLNGTRRVLYRLPQVIAAVGPRQTIYVCEGEKDAEALERLGVVATTNSGGAKKWRPEFSEFFRGADVVIVQHKDEDGRAHAGQVVGLLANVASSVRVVEALEGNDAYDHLAAGHGLEALVPVPPPKRPEDRKTGSQSASLSKQSSRSGDRNGTGKPPEPEPPPDLALEPEILACFRDDLPRAALAGEKRLAQLVYLCLTSRLNSGKMPTNRPVSPLVKGSTSTGKSHATQTTLKFFPESAYHVLGSISKRYLIFGDEDLAHTFLVVLEWASIARDEELVASLRTLLSEHRLIHGTTEEGEDRKRKGRKIEKPGPTGLLVTTTMAAIDPEMETRCLAMLTNDTREQTRGVLQTLGQQETQAADLVDFATWQEFQGWLARGETRVVVPFASALAEKMPVTAPRIRRDFGTLLSLVRAHALLHRESRDRDREDKIVAEIDRDYEVVRDLAEPLISEGVGATVSKPMRDTVKAVEELIAQGADHVTVSKLSERLEVGSTATYDRVNAGLVKGYLVNKSEKGPKKLVVGTGLPDRDGGFLPTKDDVFREYSGSPTGKVFGSTMHPGGGDSAIPVIAVDPQEEHRDEDDDRASSQSRPSFDATVVARDWDGNPSFNGRPVPARRTASGCSSVTPARHTRRSTRSRPGSRTSHAATKSSSGRRDERATLRQAAHARGASSTEATSRQADRGRPAAAERLSRKEVRAASRAARHLRSRSPAEDVNEGRLSGGWECLCGREPPKRGSTVAPVQTIVSLREPRCPFCNRVYKDEYRIGVDDEPR